MPYHITLPIVGLLILTSLVPAVDIPAPRPVPIAALVERLGSDSFDEREASTKRLAALNLDVIPKELSKALESDDPEVRKRATVVVEAIQNRIVERVIGRGLAFAHRGDVSLFVAATAKWTLPADNPRVWDAPFEVAAEITSRAQKGGWKPSGSFPWRDRKLYFAMRTPERVLTSGLYTPKEKRGEGRETTLPHTAIVREYVSPKGSQWSVIVAVGKASVTGGMKSTGLFCNGDLVHASRITDSLVVCDGDLQAEVLDGAIIIARGNIRVTRSPGMSLLIAGGDITCDAPNAAKPQLQNTFKPREPNPLGFVKFFELSRVGLDVTDTDKVVRVKAVADGAFAKAGAKVGDVVEGVNGAKPDSAESLRRLLRDALALGDATVAVRRADAKHTLRVVLPE
jgi:hypothetical protein